MKSAEAPSSNSQPSTGFGQGNTKPSDTSETDEILSIEINELPRNEVEKKEVDSLMGGATLQPLVPTQTTTKDKSSLAPSATEVSLQGAVDQSLVLQVLKKQSNKFEFCYQKALRDNPTLQGSVVTEFVIAEDGTVPSVAIEKGLEKSVDDCVRITLLRLMFPEARGGNATVRYSFVFKEKS